VLAHDPEPYAILELPLFAGPERGRSEGLYTAYQLIHGKYRFSSSLARDHKGDNPNLLVRQSTLFRDFFWFDKDSIRESYRPTKTPDFLPAPKYPDVSLPLLNYYHVRYLVLYLDALRDTGPAALSGARGVVHQAIGGAAQPVYEDTLMEVYRVPDAPPLASPLFLDTGTAGWWAPEKTPEGVPFRWADTRDGKAAELLVFNLSQEPHKARVQFTMFNYKRDRTVTIAMNGAQVDRFVLADSVTRDVTLDLDVLPGLNMLTLSSPEAPLPVQIDPKQGRDNRMLSFSVRQVRIAPANG